MWSTLAFVRPLTVIVGVAWILIGIFDFALR